MQADESKLKTIMQNIKKYASNGNFSFRYQSGISYNMAKILIEQGYVLYKEIECHKLSAIPLDDFMEKRRTYGIHICWGGNVEIY